MENNGSKRRMDDKLWADGMSTAQGNDFGAMSGLLVAYGDR